MGKTSTFGIPVRNGVVSNGGMNTQPLPSPSNGSASAPTAGASSGIVQPSSGNSSAVGVTLPNASLANPAITPPSSVSALGAGRLSPPVPIDIPQIGIVTAHILPPNEAYPVDVLNIAETRISNNQFVPVSDNGISPFRPEIIAILDFASVWKKGSLFVPKRFVMKQNSDVGDFIDIQYQASHLRQETLLKLVEHIQITNRNTTADDRFNAVRNEYLAELHSIDVNISNFRDILQNIDNLRKALQVKEIPKTIYNTTFFLPLEEFFEKKMMYPKAQFSVFSDTKLMLQLLSDFRFVLEGYSTSLIDAVDPDRQNDFSPVQIDKTYSQTNGFTFSIGNLRSVSQPINATNNNFFNQFLNSLPHSPDDRIKILTVLFAKEYLVSKGLGNTSIKKLLTEFNSSDQGNPFDNIIGDIGNTIFEPPKGPNSLASLMYIDPGIPNASVLPFESKYVDSDDQKFVYVPGSAYFADAVLNLQGNNWNTAPFVNYSNTFNNRVKDARTLIETLLDFGNNRASPLNPQTLNDTLLSALRTGTSGLLDETNIDNDQAIITAVFKLATTDNILKNMLFQFCILVGMAANSTPEQKAIFSLLANTELSDLRGLSYVQVPTGVIAQTNKGIAVLRPYIDQLARLIETRVSSLTTKVNTDFSRILTSRDLSSTIRPKTTSTTVASGLGPSLSTNLIGTTGITSLLSKTAGMLTIQVQRGNIANVLTSVVTSRSTNTTNFIKEFVDLAATFFKEAQIQGANVHLLQDGTNRTRYNFLSCSTQLLLLFEILCSYVNRYSFSTFERSNNLLVSTVSIDTNGSKLVKATIDQIARGAVVVNDASSLISSTVKTSSTTNSQTGGSQRAGVEVVSAGGATMNTGRTSSGVGITIVGNRGKPSARILAPANSSRSNSKTAYSNNVLNQITADIANALQGSDTFSDTLATNTQSATDLRNIALTLNSDVLDRVLTGIDKFSSVKTSLATNQKKIFSESITLANFLHILTIVSTYLHNAANVVQSSFNQQTLQSFLRTNGIQNLNLLKNPAQVRTAAYLLQNFKDKTDAFSQTQGHGPVQNNLVISDTVSQQEYDVMLALLSETNFLPEANSDRKVKIIPVGIPSGFSKQLADRIAIGQVNKNTYRDKEFDVVSVNVYRRDARFDDVVLKPQKFLFDLSLYPLEKDVKNINPGANESFSRMILRAQVTDFRNLTSTKKVDLRSITQDSKYNFLQDTEKTQLVRNHLVSYLLGMYFNFMTGMRVSEDVFIQGSAATTTSQIPSLTTTMESIVFSYLRDVERVNIPAGQSIEQLLRNPTLSADTKDILRLFTFGSLVFSPQEVRQRVLTPKLFDRVFLVPLDIENYEVDLDLTLSTESGRLAWAQKYVQERVTQRANRFFMKPRNKNDLIFEDYFVSIEALDDR